jgi:hypothetical protein
MTFWKARFAKDRWTIVRVSWFQREGDQEPSSTEFLLMNKYNGKIRRKRVTGYWKSEDFPDNTFRGCL